jgi:Tfp pilus assembly protein PilO
MADQQPSILDRIPMPLRAVLFLVLLAIIGYQVYQRVFSPRIAQISTLDTQITQQSMQVAQLEAQVRGHKPVTAEERAQWARTQSQIEDKIPQDYKLSELVEQIATLAKKNDLRDALISTNEKVAMPKPAEAESGAIRPAVATSSNEARNTQAQALPNRPPHITDIISAGYFPITITFHGQFRNQGQFLEDLTKLPQLIEMDILGIAREYPETAFRIILKAYHSGKVTRV